MQLNNLATETAKKIGGTQKFTHSQMTVELFFKKLDTEDVNLIFALICDIENIIPSQKVRLTTLFNGVYGALSELYLNNEIENLDIKVMKEWLNLDSLVKLYKTRRDFPNHIRIGLLNSLQEIKDYQDISPKQSSETEDDFFFLSTCMISLIESISIKKLCSLEQIQPILKKFNARDNRTIEETIVTNFLQNIYFEGRLSLSQEKKLLSTLRQQESNIETEEKLNISQILIDKNLTLLYRAVDQYFQYFMNYKTCFEDGEDIKNLDINSKIELISSNEYFIKYQKDWSGSLIELILSHNDSNLFINFMKHYEIPFTIPLFKLISDEYQPYSLLSYCLQYNIKLLEDLCNQSIDFYTALKYEVEIYSITLRGTLQPLAANLLTERDILLLIKYKNDVNDIFNFADLIKNKYNMAFIQLYKKVKALNPDFNLLDNYDNSNLLLEYIENVKPSQYFNNEILNIFASENYEINNENIGQVKEACIQLAKKLDSNEVAPYVVATTEQLLPVMSEQLSSYLLQLDSNTLSEVIVTDNECEKDEYKVQWYSPSSLLKGIQSNKGSKDKLLKDILENYPYKKPLLRVENEDFFDKLEQDIPNFKEVIDYYKGQFRQNYYSNKSHITPILLLGEPGIGKTYFAKQLAKCLNTGYNFIDMGSITASWVLTGNNGTWQDAKHGKILEAMLNSPTVNPIVLMDEIDKASSSRYDPLAPLHQLLEEINAKEFTDEFAEMTFDASGIIYIACANSINTLSDPLLSRFKVFEVPSPTYEQLDNIINNMYKIAVENNPIVSKELPIQVIDYLKSNSLRESKVMIEEAISRLMLSCSRKELNNLKLTGKHLTLDISHFKDKKTKTKIGF